MVEKEIVIKFLNKTVVLELTETNLFYKGCVKEVTDSSLFLELLNGKDVAIALSEIRFIREVDG